MIELHWAVLLLLLAMAFAAGRVHLAYRLGSKVERAIAKRQPVLWGGKLFRMTPVE